jgi:hypothetical protein
MIAPLADQARQPPIALAGLDDPGSHYNTATEEAELWPTCSYAALAKALKPGRRLHAEARPCGGFDFAHLKIELPVARTRESQGSVKAVLSRAFARCEVGNDAYALVLRMPPHSARPRLV